MFVSPRSNFSRSQPEEPAHPPLVDNPFAPELFVSGFAGFCHSGGMVQLTLDSLRCDHSRTNPVMERVVVGRVTLSVPVAQALVTTLNHFLEQQGCSPAQALAGGASFQ